jgi:hypothetical protein
MSVHGYIAYQPKRYGESVLAAARNILVEYEAWENPLTVRQIFYRLIAEYRYEKTEGAYNALVGYVARARRAYMHRLLERPDGEELDFAREMALKHPWLIPFSWIRDERGQSIEPIFYTGEEDFVAAMRRAAENLSLDRQAGQAQVLELWCEAAGMVPLMREIATPYSIRVSSGGGYDSVTAKHDLAQRIVQRYAAGQPTTILHVGDFDPSGEGMFGTLADDVTEMVRQYTHQHDSPAEFQRIALTEEQVIEMNVETAPPKPLDSRARGFVADHPRAVEHFGSEQITAQLEALAPPELRALIESAIESRIATAAYGQALANEADVRAAVLDRLDPAGDDDDPEHDEDHEQHP